ncbi:hypothetical protein [Enhygromyxa salina]|nr:hypothetical protein [Enhygromyxa salina]
MRRFLVAVCVVLLTTSCAGTIGRVLDDHRGTEQWTRSSEAFKTIMRKYVHGDNHSFTDADLDQQFEDYLTLGQADVDKFIEDQSCLPAAGSGPARYYMANATHQRHDAFYAKDQARPITGTGDGGQTMHATFSANLLLERHEISPTSSFPARAAYDNNQFPDWASIERVMTTRAAFDETFALRDSAQAEQVFNHTQGIDWAKQASGELYIAPELVNGKIFSPALFAVYLFRSEPSAAFSVYLVISANAAGEPQSSHVGLINTTRETTRERDYESYTGFAFTYISAKDNLLDYELVMDGEDPTTFVVWITTAYPDHPESPYLTVRTAFLPAVSEQAIAAYKDTKGVSLIMMLRKGAIMRDLVAGYYPDAPELQLWEDIGALKNDPTFKERLESAGLTVAAGLFEASLWLERPVVRPSGSDGPPQYEVADGAAQQCASGSGG